MENTNQFDQFSKNSLVAMAKNAGIKGAGRMNKSQLIEALEGSSEMKQAAPKKADLQDSVRSRGIPYAPRMNKTQLVLALVQSAIGSENPYFLDASEQTAVLEEIKKALENLK